MPFKFLIVLAILLSVLFITVQAAEKAPSGNDVIGVSTVSQISAKVESVLSRVHSEMSSAGSNLVPIGKYLLYSFMGIGLTWLGIKFTLGTDVSQIMGNLLEIIMKWGIAAWLLRDYATWGRWISSGFDTVIVAFGGQGGAGAVEALIKISLFVVSGIWNVVGEGAKSVAITQISSIGIFLILVVTSALVAFIFARALLVASVIILAASIFFDVLWMLGPLFIPFIIGWMFSPMFQNWLNFLIAAGLYKVIAAALILAISAILTASGFNNLNIDNAQNTIFSFTDGKLDMSAFSLLNILLLLFFALVIEFLTKQIPSIASGLSGVRAIEVGVGDTGGMISKSSSPKSAEKGKNSGDRSSRNLNEVQK